MRFSVEFILLTLVIMWLVNLLSYIPPLVKDVINSVVIILLVLFWFIL